MLPEQEAAGFGDVWEVATAGGTAPRLIVSGRRFASARPEMVLAVIVDAPPANPSYAVPASGLLGEEIPGVGRAQLDLITVVYRDRLARKRAEVPSERQASIGDRIRDLIGP